MKKIFIVRHGKTEWNLEKRLQGSGCDSPLLLADLKDYEALARYLDPFSFAAVFSSPIKRAVRTAETVTSRFQNHPLPKPISVLDELAELSFGGWEGRTRKELIESRPQAFKMLSQRKDCPELAEIGVENFEKAGERFARGIDKISRMLEEGQAALVFSHGAIIQLGIRKLTRNPNIGGLANLSTSIISEKDGRFILSSYNETAYLQTAGALEGNTSIL